MFVCGIRGGGGRGGWCQFMPSPSSPSFRSHRQRHIQIISHILNFTNHLFTAISKQANPLSLVCARVLSRCLVRLTQWLLKRTLLTLYPRRKPGRTPSTICCSGRSSCAPCTSAETKHRRSRARCGIWSVAGSARAAQGVVGQLAKAAPCVPHSWNRVSCSRLGLGSSRQLS